MVKVKLSKSKIFLLSCLSFIFGVGIGSFLKIELFYIFIAFVAIFLFICFFWSKSKIRYVLLFILCLIAGLARYQISIHSSSNKEISFYNDQGQSSFTGKVVDLDSRLSSQQLIIKSEKKDEKDVRGKVLVKTGLYPEYQLGQKLEVKCSLKTPETIEDFAYDRYLARYDIYSVCYRPWIKTLETDRSVFIAIKSLRFKLKEVIDTSMIEPQASVFSAMFLGLKREIPREILDNFSRTGISHIIAISGMHVSILSGIMMSLLIGLGVNRKRAFWFLSLFLVFYVILAGAPVSAIRAASMGFLVLLALRLGRLANSINSLMLLAAMLLLFNPKLLRDDIGFQLSFLAVLGLIYIGSYLDKRVQKLPSCLGVKEGLIMTLSAQVFTLPLIAYHFGRISIIAPIANILVIPVLPFILMIGSGALAVGLLVPILAKVMFWPVWLMLAYVLKVAEVLASLPWASWEI